RTGAKNERRRAAKERHHAAGEGDAPCITPTPTSKGHIANGQCPASAPGERCPRQVAGCYQRIAPCRPRGQLLSPDLHVRRRHPTFQTGVLMSSRRRGSRAVARSQWHYLLHVCGSATALLWASPGVAQADGETARCLDAYAEGQRAQKRGTLT